MAGRGYIPITREHSDIDIFMYIIAVAIALYFYARHMGWIDMVRDAIKRPGAARAKLARALLICGAILVLAVCVYMVLAL